MQNVLNTKPNAVGTGLMKGTADVFKSRKKWRDQYINGETSLQFKAWLKEKGGNVSSMPRSSHN